MLTIIAILNQKGGVGKTTIAVTLASGFARHGYQVLLVDLDTQGNVADSLGIPQSDDLRRLLSPDLRQPLEQVITPSGLERLCVIRSDKSTAGLKQTLAGMTLREYILADSLEAADYDLIFLACAPSVDVLHFAALVAADYLLIPSRLDKLAVKVFATRCNPSSR
jgi:chromosome partitioning protein